MLSVPAAAGSVLPALVAGWRAARWLVVAHVVASVGVGVIPVASVWLLRLVIDALTGRSREVLGSAAVGFVVAGLLALVLPAAVSFVSQEMERVAGRAALSELYLSMARCQGLARLEEPRFRDRLRMALQGGRAGPGQAVHGVLGAVQGVVTLFGLIGVLAAISPIFSVVAVLGLAPALVAQIQLSRARARMLVGLSPIERREQFYAELQTSITAGKELRLLGLFELFRGRMLGELAVANGRRRRMDVRDLGTQVGLGALSALILGGGIIWAINAASRGALGVGDVSAFIAAMTALQAGLATFVGRISLLHRALLLYGYFREVLTAEPDLPLAVGPQRVRALRRGIELRDVWFRYAPDQQWVLRGVNLFIPHGSAVALVGVNGVGKSTLAKLLCRFYDPQRGAVLWDGVDLRELAVDQLRERIGALFQDYMKYDLSAAENVGLGDLAGHDDRGRIRDAADRAGIAETLERLPRGYDTMLSRMFLPAGDENDDGAAGGVLLSGGQWQRLALARTFMRDRRDLLILDEPNAGLDAQAEYEIHQCLRRHRTGATSVLISHRLGTVHDADQIAVLADGVVSELGTHNELLAADGDYARLFAMQAEGYQRTSMDLGA
jgi:ATP-binding cassette, subfamily B, bacterial